MLGDVLLITEKHQKAAQQMLKIIETVQKKKVIIAISGESGSGKSELAHSLARELKTMGTPAKIMHIDNYYKVLPVERTAWRKAHGVESIGYDEYDWDLINRNIQEFLEDKDAEMPCIDLLTDQVDTLKTTFKSYRFLIVEGLYAIKAQADLRFLIDITYHESKKAQLLRGKEPQNEFRLQVLEQEHKMVQSIRNLVTHFVTKDFDILPNPDKPEPNRTTSATNFTNYPN